MSNIEQIISDFKELGFETTSNTAGHIYGSIMFEQNGEKTELYGEYFNDKFCLTYVPFKDEVKDIIPLLKDIEVTDFESLKKGTNIIKEFRKNYNQKI